MAKKCEICNREKADADILTVTNFKQCGNDETTVCKDCYNEYAGKFTSTTCAADYLSLTRIFLKDHGVRPQHKGAIRCEQCNAVQGVRVVTFPDNPTVAPMFMCERCTNMWRAVKAKLPANIPLPDDILLNTLTQLRRRS